MKQNSKDSFFDSGNDNSNRAIRFWDGIGREKVEHKSGIAA